MTTVVDTLRKALCALPDVRKGGNNLRYTMGDAALGAFSVFFMQSPSFLDFQVRMQKSRGRNHASSLFGIAHIPSMQQIRNLLDPVSPAQVAPLFMALVEPIVADGGLTSHRVLDGRLLVALDGTEHHGSEAIHCSAYFTRTLANGKTQYDHTAVTPVIVAPGQAAVLPLAPEFVVPQDGQAKQDGEIKAGTRWLQRRGAPLKAWHTTLLGDDRYCHQPFCEQVLAQGGEYIFVYLPGSPPLLYEWVADFARTGEVATRVKTRWTGKQHLTDTYRWLNDLPLRDGDETLKVGWCELTTTDAGGKVLYRNAWASSMMPITQNNVIAIVDAGRSRWKIENEHNHTLKTKGYHFEHNYGHVKQHLANLLASLNLLAFLAHTLLDRYDPRYQHVRGHLSSRRTFFEHLRALTCYFPFDTWEHLFDSMIEALQPAHPSPRRRAGMQ